MLNVQFLTPGIELFTVYVWYNIDLGKIIFGKIDGGGSWLQMFELGFKKNLNPHILNAVELVCLIIRYMGLKNLKMWAPILVVSYKVIASHTRFKSFKVQF